jgi:hypothetical protein
MKGYGSIEELIGGAWFVRMVGGGSERCVVCIGNEVKNRSILLMQKKANG